jgi:hypothetical protein
MKKASLLLASLALASGSAFGDIDRAGSEGKLTLSLTITSAGPSTENASGTRQNLVTTRFGNREVLQLLFQEAYIPTITGYALVERFDGNGNRINYYAVNKSTEHEVNVPWDILCEVNQTGVAGYDVNTRNNKELGARRSHSTLKLDEVSLSLLEEITISTGTTRLDGTPTNFFIVSIKGKVQGSLEDGEVIEGTANVARSTIFENRPV